MIEVDSRPPAAFTEDAVTATVFMATVHVREGELMLPQRIRDHLADGPVVVHLMRGEDDVAVHEATLTSRSTLTGIEWPEDVLPRTSLTVLCPRGGASHDIGVLLPNLNVDWPDADLPDPKLEPVSTEDASEPAEDSEPVSDEQLAAITGALTALADAAAPTLSGPAGCDVPTKLRLVADEPTETIAAVGWPAVEPADDEAPAEQTAIVPAVGTLPPRESRAWLAWTVVLTAIFVGFPAWILDQVAMRVRWSARWSLERPRTAAGLILGVLSLLVLAGTGVLWLLLEVAR